MNIKFDRVLNNPISNTVIFDDGKPTTLGAACAAALVAPGPQQTPKENIAAYRLAMRVAAADVAEVDASEIVLMQEALARVYAPLIAGQAAWMLENP